MLTREQALTKYCPHKFPVTAVAGIIAGLEPDSEELIAAINCNCTANDCPKWVDDEIKVYPEEGYRTSEVVYRCAHVRHGGDAEICMSGKHNFCSDCPHRYGRCGG